MGSEVSTMKIRFVLWGMTLYDPVTLFRSVHTFKGRRERVRPPGEKTIPPPGKGRSKVTKQRAPYARWPLAASAVHTTNHT